MHNRVCQNVEFRHQDMVRRYLLYVPFPSSDEAFPLVLVLHGAGGRAEDAAAHYGWLEKAKKEFFIVAFPQAASLNPLSPTDFKTNPTNWNDGHQRRNQIIDDVSFIREIVYDISSRYRIDGKRIYITGFSNGASMAFRIGVELSELFAAVAAVSGHLWLEDPHPIRPISLLLIAGAQDPFKPLEGGIEKNPWLEREEMIPPMEFTIKKWIQLIGVEETQKTVKRNEWGESISYGPNRSGLVVIFLIIAGQGHEWPGGGRVLPKRLSGNNVQIFHATEAIWDFFSTQILQ